MTGSFIRVRDDYYDPATHQIKGEVRTKLGRGPWSYWISFEEDADDVREACPSLAERVMPRFQEVVIVRSSAVVAERSDPARKVTTR